MGVEPKSFVPLPSRVHVSGWHHNIFHCIDHSPVADPFVGSYIHWSISMLMSLSKGWDFQ